MPSAIFESQEGRQNSFRRLAGGQYPAAFTLDLLEFVIRQWFRSGCETFFDKLPEPLHLGRAQALSDLPILQCVITTSLSTA